jgi:hypothetical protein
MMQRAEQSADSRQGAGGAAAAGSHGQQPWEEPKLTFLDPKLLCLDDGSRQTNPAIVNSPYAAEAMPGFPSMWPS